MRVFVYYNLHKHCFSVKALEGPAKGLVILHTQRIWLEQARFKVSQAGRQRVLRERRKNVHAGVEGQWLPAEDSPHPLAAQQIRYNPYLFDQFVLATNGNSVHQAERVCLDHGHIWAEGLR